MNIRKSEERGRPRGNSFLTATLLLAIFFLGATVGFSRGINEVDRVIGVSNKEGGSEITADFSPFWKVWNTLEEKHVDVENVSDQEKVWAAIRGLSSAYNDPYTRFLDPEEAKQIDQEIRGNFEGVGIEIGIRDNVLTVISPIRNTPAERAGIQAGDKIIAIDGEESRHLLPEEAARRIRGEKGTPVVLTISRTNQNEELDIEIFRDTIKIPVLDARLIEDDVYFIELYGFPARSSTALKEKLEEFLRSPADKLVLDLRNNPGGFLDEAIEMASHFVAQGKTIVQEKYSDGRDTKTYRSKGFGTLDRKDFTMAVLVNGGSASASEILAGALSEYDIATIVGSQTFGKGTIQELVRVTSDTYLKVTIARWLTPGGLDFSEGGISPDLEVDEFVSFEEESGKDPVLEKAIHYLSQ